MIISVKSIKLYNYIIFFFDRFLQRQDSEIKRMLKEPPASLLEADFVEVNQNLNKYDLTILIIFLFKTIYY